MGVNDIRRLTEQDELRRTEQADVRILERLVWAIEPRTFASWNTSRAATHRQTEQDDRRITEQGEIRIIEGSQIWSNQAVPAINIWTKE